MAAACCALVANFYVKSDMSTAHKSTNRDDYQLISRPVGAMAKDFPRGFVSRRHRHVRAQLLYAVDGVLKVATDVGLWVIPPQRAVWIPPQVDHEVCFMTAASVRTLYIEPSAIPAGAPALPCAVNVSPLLRELVIRATTMPMDYDVNGRDGRIVALALEELEWAKDPALHLPAFKDRRLTKICQALQAHPMDPRTLEEWAAAVNTSSRTLARLFRAEAATSFQHWRQQVRVMAALPRLAAGEAVTSVAFDLGYETPGAFAAMFRRLMGTVPSQYFHAQPPVPTKR
jgi:AraC-like DNA-binding protein/quercetin dioxygenase-like cupin family protein